MKLLVIDRKETCENPEDFEDYLHRYALHVVVEEHNDVVKSYSIGYCKDRNDYDKIVEIVNNQEFTQWQHEYELKEQEHFWKREIGLDEDEIVECPECGFELDSDDVLDINLDEELECFACGHRFKRT